MDTNISNTVLMERCGNSSDENIGPARLTEIFGATMLVVYSLLPLLLSLLALYGLHYRPRPDHPFRLHILLLQLAPVGHLVITFPVLLSPATIPLVSLLQDLLVMVAMVVFINFTLNIIGSLENVETSCPIGTPPLCCLLCCRKPKINSRTAGLILLPFKLTPVALVINFLINLYLTYSGVQGKITLGDFFGLENLHNILLIPFFLSTMYCWKIFVSVTTTAMPNKNQMLRGSLLFFMFIISKTVPAILAILTDNDIIPCLPGLPAIRVAALLVPLVEMFFISVIAVVIPRLYNKTWVRQLSPRAEDEKNTNSPETTDMLLQQNKIQDE